MFLTIYTPTFNRANTLDRLYKSLLRQTNKNFIWLVIDDGSTDDTKKIVSNYIKDDKIKIQYYYQNNKGKMEAVNYAHDLINTDLNTCLDSDDFFVDNAVEIIHTKWLLIKDNEKLAGMVGLDCYHNGDIVGDIFPDGYEVSKFSDFFGKKVKGDKKFIYKTNVIQKYPKYPFFNNEKFPADGYLYRLIDKDYDLYLFNEVLCIVEYLEDGLSKGTFKSYEVNPNSYRFYRAVRIRLADNSVEKFKHGIHYVSSSIFAKKSIFLANNIFVILVSIVPGIILNLLIRFKNRKWK